MRLDDYFFLLYIKSLKFVRGIIYRDDLWLDPRDINYGHKIFLKIR